MAKQIIYGDEARAKMKSGIEKVANAVKVTLGPKGRSVVLEKKFKSASSIILVALLPNNVYYSLI